MKSKQIDFTEEYIDLIKVAELASFLYQLNIASAFDLEHQAGELHSDVYCGECTSEIDHCECNSDGRYMSQYDDGADYED